MHDDNQFETSESNRSATRFIGHTMEQDALNWLAGNRADLSSAQIKTVATMLSNASKIGRWLPPADDFDADEYLISPEFVNGNGAGQLTESVKETYFADEPDQETLAEFLGSIANMMGWKVR